MRRSFGFLFGLLLCGLMTGTAHANAYSDLNAGISAFTRGNIDDTIRFMNAALASPDLPDKLKPVAYFDRGSAYAEKGNMAQALVDYSACLALEPNYYEALLRRSLLLQQTKQNEAALADLSVAVSKRPFLSLPYVLRGAIYADQNKNEAAIADYNHVVQLDPKAMRGYIVRAELYRRIGRYEDALRDNNQAIALVHSGEVFSERGRTYEAKGDYALALEDYREAARLMPENRDRYLVVGVLQWNLSEFHDSIASFEAWMRDNPTAYAVIWIDLARSRASVPDADLTRNAARFDLNKWPGALVRLLMGTASPADAFKAASIGETAAVPGQICEANFYVAQWYLLRKNVEAARPMLQKAAASCPKDFIELRSAEAELKRLP